MRVVSSRRGDPRWSGGVLKRKIDYFFSSFRKFLKYPKSLRLAGLQGGSGWEAYAQLLGRGFAPPRSKEGCLVVRQPLQRGRSLVVNVLPPRYLSPGSRIPCAWVLNLTKNEILQLFIS